MQETVEQVKERIKEAKKKYGLSYNILAREIGIAPTTIYRFSCGCGNLSRHRQVQAMEVIDEYVKRISKWQ